MYLRVNEQERFLENLALLKQSEYPAQRVTNGYVVSHYLEIYKRYLSSMEAIDRALIESDSKQGAAKAVGLNLRETAYQNLKQLKEDLDRATGRKLFPAQVLDILLLLVLDKKSSGEQDGAETDDIRSSDIVYALVPALVLLLKSETHGIELGVKEQEIKDELAKTLLKLGLLMRNK